jgi:hypothetical protein
MEAGQRQALLRSLVPAARVYEDFPELFAQSDMAGQIVYCSLKRFNGAVHHSVLHEQFGVNYGALWIELA